MRVYVCNSTDYIRKEKKNKWNNKSNDVAIKIHFRPTCDQRREREAIEIQMCPEIGAKTLTTLEYNVRSGRGRGSGEDRRRQRQRQPNPTQSNPTDPNRGQASNMEASFYVKSFISFIKKCHKWKGEKNKHRNRSYGYPLSYSWRNLKYIYYYTYHMSLNISEYFYIL